MTVPVDVLRLGESRLPLYRASNPPRLIVAPPAGPALGAALHLLTALQEDTDVACDRGDARLDRAGAVQPVHAVRTLDADHTNTIHVADERYVVEWYTGPAIGTTREQVLLERLTRAGCDVTPELVGALTWESDDTIPTTLALVTEYLPDAVDGWTTLERLDPLRDEDRLLALCEDFALAQAEVHLALAQGTPVRLGAAARLERIADRVAEARATVPGVPAPPPHGGVGSLPVQEVHGDVHLGQFLVTSARVHLVDLEGDQTEEPKHRARLDTPLRDLAALRRSLVLLHLWRRSEYADPPATRVIYERALRHLTDSYVAANPNLPEEWPTWLPSLELEKAAGELLYAHRFLPSWLPTARASYLDACASLGVPDTIR